MVYELQTRFDTRQSFYGKALVEVNEKTTKLYSYGTLVCEVPSNDTPIVYGTYSQTTLRHIKEFIKQEGFKADNKQQIINDYYRG